MNSMVKIALRFRSDLLPMIEQNRRRSQGFAEDFAIEWAAKMAKKMRCKMIMLFVYSS